MDRLVYLNGRTYVRKFDDWEDGFGYKLYIGEEGGYQSYVAVGIERDRYADIATFNHLYIHILKILNHLMLAFQSLYHLYPTTFGYAPS